MDRWPNAAAIPERVLGPRALAAAAALALAGAAGCGASPATRTLLRESAPSVRRYEQMRADLAARDEAAAALVRKGGCPVCAW